LLEDHLRIPAMVNAHSHAFQIELRGVGERPARARTAGAPDVDDFWSWRTEMYRLAAGHDPDSMHAVAARTYGDMARAGYGAVGEFHYVHHQPDGTPYEEPNAMAIALASAAREAGLEIVLLPAAYNHACEQRRELDECRAEHDCSPIELLERCGFLGRRTSIVHGIHVTDRDIELIAAAGAIVVACPTTEGNLGDGHQPALRYRAAGVRYAVGSDSQVRIDPFEEARELETGARREGQTRSALLAAAGDEWQALVEGGRASLGLTGPPVEIELDLDHPDLAGIAPQDVPYAVATCASAAVVKGISARAHPLG
jgi:cytosine/adenosine deaminase-related metal-dependent hydrolase